MNKFAWLVSYPRSGNTWIRLLLANIQHPEKPQGYIATEKFVPDLHQLSKTYKCNFNDLKKKNLGWSPVVVKSHHISLPEYNDWPCVYLYRDGRDVVLSYYIFERYMKKHDLTWHEYLERFIAGNLQFGSWKKHVQHWLNKTDNVLTISYELLLEHPVETMAMVCEFLKIEVTEGMIEEAVIKTSYRRLREEVAPAEGAHPDLVGRTGKQGTWRTDFTQKQKNMFDEYAGDLLRKLYI